MEKIFSTHWKESKQPRKQIKYRTNAPLHIRRKFVSVNLSKELRKKIGKRNVVLRKGDMVKIMRGDHKNQKGKVSEVSIRYGKIIIEGIQVKKRDGSKVNLKFQPSNLQIIELSERDNSKKKENVKGEKK